MDDTVKTDLAKLQADLDLLAPPPELRLPSLAEWHALVARVEKLERHVNGLVANPT